MQNFNAEMLEKAKTVNSAEALLALAKENDIEMTEDEAATYFSQLNPKSGELDDDELDNVAGGLVQLINPSSTSCYNFHDKTIKCQYCGDHNGKYKNNRMICLSCKQDMVGRSVDKSEVFETSTGRL